MEVEYVNSNINTLFSDLFDIVDSRNLLQKKIGPILAKKTKMRISHLKSSSTFVTYFIYEGCLKSVYSPSFLKVVISNL